MSKPRKSTVTYRKRNTKNKQLLQHLHSPFLCGETEQELFVGAEAGDITLQILTFPETLSLSL